MDRDDDDWQEVLEKLMLLKNSWPGSAWEWDPRFTMIASSFAKEQETQARQSAVRAMPYAWDPQSVLTAPAGLRTICEGTGGLRKGQMLMAGKAGHVVVYGLWWPWGGGATITLRIGLGEHTANEAPFPKVRELFGVKGV